MQNLTKLLASTFGFISSQGLTSTNVEDAIDEGYQKSAKLADVNIFTDTTQSTTKDNGCLVLEGGLGVEKAINSGGSIKTSDTTSTTNTTTGSGVFGGGVGVAENLYVGGILVLANYYPALCARRTTNLSLSTNALTIIPYNSEDQDTHAAYNNATGTFTVPVNCAGKYRVEAGIAITFSGTAGTAIIVLSVYVNGVLYAELDRALCTGVSGATDGCGGSVSIPNLSVGDAIDIRVTATYASGTITVAGSSRCSLSISRMIV